jgi:subtilisin family serine protease
LPKIRRQRCAATTGVPVHSAAHQGEITLRAQNLAVAVAATAVAVVVGGGLPASAQSASAAPAAQPAAIVYAGGPDAIKDSYIVVFKDAVSAQGTDARVAGVAARHGIRGVKLTYRAALSGFAATMSERQASQLAADPDIALVEQDRVVRVATEQVNPGSWGLDRIDQLNRPLNSRYGYPDDGGSKVHAYVLDTGIRTTHVEFGGRATSGFDAIDGGTADDCQGHGTHVAGTIGGSTYGVAKSVRLVAVRVLDCAGNGTVAGVIAGVDWVTANAVRPAVANMSLSGAASDALDAAVVRSSDAGITYMVAAGNNSGANACGRSPARVGAAITVGATDRNDKRAGFSNIGSCVDIFAPGVDITSAWRTSDTATNTIDGTSMASPHVAGVAALILQVHPGMTYAQLSGHLKSNASPKVTDAGSGSPNLLLRLIHGPIVGMAGKCVDVQGGGIPNSTPVQLFECNGTPAQEWQYTASALYNARSGRCLDVRGGNMANSTPVQIFDCNGSLAQAWRWSPERHELFIRADTARCLDVRGGNPANSTPIQIFDCNNTPAQDWNLPLD